MTSNGNTPAQKTKRSAGEALAFNASGKIMLTPMYSCRLPGLEDEGFRRALAHKCYVMHELGAEEVPGLARNIGYLSGVTSVATSTDYGCVEIRFNPLWTLGQGLPERMWRHLFKYIQRLGYDIDERSFWSETGWGEHMSKLQWQNFEWPFEDHRGHGVE